MLPFTLNGPQFLLFYALFAALVLLGWQRYRRAAPPGGDKAEPMLGSLTGDPYAIACLRGGPDEAVRVAVVNLIDRGLLVEAKAGHWRTSMKTEPALQRRPLDAMILAQCSASPMSPEAIVADRLVRQSAAVIESGLQGQGLLQTAAALARQKSVRRGVLGLLAGVALLRIVQALLAGRSNIEFLVIMALVACGLALAMAPARLTPSGRHALDALQALLGRLKDRARRLVPGGATSEAALFAAVFGIHALPEQAFAFVEQAYPRPKASDSSSSGGDSGSSSDSGGSSCSSGSSGCGGCGSGE